jgi:hypothetical protein
MVLGFGGGIGGDRQRSQSDDAEQDRRDAALDGDCHMGWGGVRFAADVGVGCDGLHGFGAGLLGV